MKKMTCELCGSNQFSKKDGMFVCDYCNTKYSLEEAKKIMIDGPVTVHIDEGNKLEKFKKLANEAFDDDLIEEAKKYYSKILEIDSEDWYATFYRGVCLALLSNLNDFRLEDARKGAIRAEMLIEKAEIPDEEKSDFFFTMANQLNQLAVSFNTTAVNHYNEFWETPGSAEEYWERLLICINSSEEAFRLFEKCKDEESDNSMLVVAENIVIYCVEICEYRKFVSGYSNGNPVYQKFWINDDTRNDIVAIYNKYVEFIKQYNENYVAPQIRTAGSSGCFIATAVYGGYDSPELWTLRRFRDQFLAQKRLGAIFIKNYYKYSPDIAISLSSKRRLSKIIKSILSIMVKLLNKLGYSNEQYSESEKN